MEISKVGPEVRIGGELAADLHCPSNSMPEKRGVSFRLSHQ
jgi:hypothetical protein